jgi:hypothetical protein
MSVRAVAVRVVAVTAATLLLATACGSSAPSSSNGTAASATATPASDRDDFDPANFTKPTEVTNAWFPLRPGTEFTWRGHALDDGEPISRAVVFTVTGLTKVIDGVRTVVTWDRDYTEGKREEVELSFFAQDDDGTVWQMGEYPEEYDGGKIVKTPAWLGGLHGAQPGILMLADPRPGMPDYAEGWGPEVHWNDRAFPYRAGESTCVPAGCYDDVLVVDEFNPDEPGAHQLKYYARGVGGVRVGWRGRNEEEQEELALVRLRTLTPAQLAAVHRQVLEQDRRGYRYSPDVYGRTQPIEPAASSSA